MIDYEKKKEFKVFSFKSIYIYMFLFIFTPFILPFSNIIHLLALIAYFFLFKSFWKEFISFFKIKSILYFIILHFFLIFFAFLHFLFEPDFVNIYNLLLTLFEVLPICLFITFYLSRFNISYVKFLEVILVLGFIQFIFVLLALLFPPFRDLTMIYFPKGSSFDDYFDILGEYRMFGFTRNYTFAMPLFMGFCTIISFVLGNFVGKKYFFLMPFYLFSIVVNARIGLVSLPIVIVVLFLYKIKYNFFGQIFGLIIAGTIILGTVLYIEMKDEESSEYSVWTWLNDGFKELGSLSKGEKTGNMELLTGSMWVFPEPEYLLLGTGENIFQNKNNQKSDIGYVLNLYYGGIIFCFFLYYSYYRMLIVYDKKILLQKTLFVSTLLFLFIANFKGLVFIPHEVTNGILLVSIFTIFYNKKSNIEII
ncbi:hypothetical protein D3C85_360700 [compost metagenome]